MAMCASCVTGLAGVGSSVTVLTAFGAHGWHRVRDRASRRPKLERDMERWETTAAFLLDHGIDPLEALGAPPAIPAADPDRSDVTT